MDGLTNIIAKIGEQNDVDCASVLESAKNKAQAILEEARVSAEKVTNDYKAEIKAKADVISSKAVSSSELEYKRVILAFKSKTLDEVIENAVKSIADCDAETYFGYIKKLVISGALCGEGVIRMSTADLGRLPKDFVSGINSELGEGKKVSVSNKAIDCDGGFVIEYPEMRVDCTLSSLVRDKHDEIRDEINKLLFA